MWLGIAVILVGFVLVAVAWGAVASRGNVALQLPYLASAGLTGVALVIVGLGIVAFAAKAVDTTARREQLTALRDELRVLRTLLEDDLHGPRP